MTTRRRQATARITTAAVVLAVSLGIVSSAASQEGLQSPIWGQVEFKLGDYLPAVDDDFQGIGPYEIIFGAGGALLFELEYTHYLWREYGSFAVGASVGFTKNTGNSLNADGTVSVDESSLSIVPTRVLAVYRFDVLPREWSIPFVPYAKFGFDMYIWWSKSEAGIATYRDPQTGQLDEGLGVTFGWHAAAGLQFLLDVLSPGMSRTFDASAGVNNTYLFAEFLYADVNDFGSDTSIDLGDATFLFGISFEF